MALICSNPMILLPLATFFILINHAHIAYSLPQNPLTPARTHDYDHHIRKLQALRSSISQTNPVSSARLYRVSSYGADPTGKTDSTEAILSAIADAVAEEREGILMDGITNHGGVQISLEGGIYMISRPMKFPMAGVGNVVISGGTLRASENFTNDSYLIDLSSSAAATSLEYNYEYITFRDIMLDCNYHGGGIRAINALRTNIDNCYITHFNTTGIFVQGGHETYIRNSFLGQHITAGGDRHERDFSGTAITLAGNDNAITDVVIFSAATGIVISGQANVLTGVHCYNKATGFGGTGVYLKLPNLTQTRIVNSYFDYTGIVAEDPVQLHVSGCFFLGDAFIVLKSIRGVVNGLNIVDNMFSGSNKGVDIVQLDQRNGVFNNIDQVVVDNNNVKGMNLKATVARGATQGNGTSWTVDFNQILLFPRHIKFVQYTMMTSEPNVFPNYVLRNISNNKVFIESDIAVSGSVSVTVDQGLSKRS
ncbi:putative endo-polygalacturonase [Helianthus annuus]|uniref:Polygalacturonase n=1 Tax=Helianthus annuus TaxID=4232 RepID=A0A251U5R7_HELAN|nr:polygalacturonase QRT3 [Helianthus annuus]KAF5768800.1 putative polygalacturonase [Helianthus annuus]KAJ0463964.1 putative endo-polygalacturonase [Helianthus annuus]KAJ0468311.1 putative endo-polygalacturonase [Helianthus annuus]KAJ0485464.1 putative endo-polygalacturonase [Helianthus annuus]KAJ0656017.1 putative endo-polygalacturonase [Helianthus annuus]